MINMRGNKFHVHAIESKWEIVDVHPALPSQTNIANNGYTRIIDTKKFAFISLHNNIMLLREVTLPLE